MDIEKVKKGLACCSIGLYCPDEECPYEVDKEEKKENCISNLCRDAMELIEEFEARKAKARALLDGLKKAAKNVPEDGSGAMTAHIVPRGLLLHTWGHGWEENHRIGDDEDPERIDLTKCVWINGHIMNEEGSNADAGSGYWEAWYNSKCGVRIWTGDEKPTEEQRKAALWDGDLK